MEHGASNIIFGHKETPRGFARGLALKKKVQVTPVEHVGSTPFHPGGSDMEQ
jgi:hypothetical protein